MSPYTKAAQSVIRLVALGLVVLSLGLYSSDLYLYLSHHPLHRPALLVLKGLPFLAALVLYGKSSALALHLTRDLD